MILEKKIDFGLFKKRKVFVTGHTGFKGSWLTKILSMAGAEVLGYSLDDRVEPNHYDLMKMNEAITSLSGDIRNFEHLNGVVAEFQPELIFHLAAQPLVRRSYREPIDTFATNFMGTVHLLEAARTSSSVRSLVYVSTDKCYENNEHIWGYREVDELGGSDPYSASKGASEIAVSSYMKSFFDSNQEIGIASARAGNVIGGGDWGIDRIVPDCIRAIESNKSVTIRNPDSTRPWQHVLEPLSGYLLLAQKLFEQPKKWDGAWNFGPSTLDVLSVSQLAERIIDKLGTGEIIINDDFSVMKEAVLLQLNCDKANRILGWYPRWDVHKTIIETSLWYAEYLSHNDVNKVTEKQIQDYFPEL